MFFLVNFYDKNDIIINRQLCLNRDSLDGIGIGVDFEFKGYCIDVIKEDDPRYNTIKEAYSDFLNIERLFNE